MRRTGSSRCLIELKSAVSPFLFLAVDLPPPPLFQDSVEKNIIPQVSIQSVLAKYDGQKTQVRRPRASLTCTPDVPPQESVGQLRRFKCQRLPPYIILHFKRFTKNQFVEEKNPTVVNFPLRGLDFRECRCPRPSKRSICINPLPRSWRLVPQTWMLRRRILPLSTT